MTILVFILLGMTVFALLLALQMRWMISIALRRALSAEFGGLPSDVAYRSGVSDAGRQVTHTEIATHLNQTYPDQLRHLRIARRVSIYTLPAIVVLIAILRFGLEAF